MSDIGSLFYFSVPTVFVQCNSDTTWGQVIFNRLRPQSSTKLPSLHTPAPTSRVSKPSALTTNWLQNGVPTTPSGLLDQLTELRNVLYLGLQFCYKECKSGPSNRLIWWGSWEPQMQSLHILRMHNSPVTSVCICITHQGSSPQL